MRPTPAQTRLIELIYSAFAEAPRPARDEITSCCCWECEGIREEFVNYAAREVPDDLVHFENAAGSLMTQTAFRYFLPRLLEFSILPSPRDSVTVENVLYRLSPEDPMNPWFRERYELFSQVERSAIADYVATRRTWPGAWVEAEHLERAERAWGMGTPVV